MERAIFSFRILDIRVRRPGRTGRRIVVTFSEKPVMEYVASHRYGFSEKECLVRDPEEPLRRRFMTDPMWEKG